MRPADLQTSALLLGYAAVKEEGSWQQQLAVNNSYRLVPTATAYSSRMERETRFELATSTLARSRSTTELLPHGKQ